ncbi:MAG: DUF4422 domain-containing protein [Eubacteriales bacterium]|jgi:hypothetical protein
MGSGKEIKIMIAMHKPYRVAQDPIYYPVHVGAEGKEPFETEAAHPILADNQGENISAKNPNYCELTGLYYMWKNVPSDYLGLVHYRRYFGAGHSLDKWERIADGNAIRRHLEQADIILPVPRNYVIETNYSQYVHAHHTEDLELTRQILEEKYPDYLPAYDRYMKRTYGHRFNMFVMKRDLADQYCAWLFDILFELERRLDISEYSAYDARVFGFVSERLIDPWIETNHYRYTEMPVIDIETVNWLKKGSAFVMRKIRGGKAQ